MDNRTEKLVERLRKADCKLNGRKLEDAADALCREAADEIARLQAEVARFRKALETIAQNDEYPLDSEGNPMPIRPQWSSHQCSSIARAALSPGGE